MKNRHRYLRSSPVIAALGAAILLGAGASPACAGTVFGVDVANYIILYEGNAGKKLDVNNFGFDGVWTGDIGVASGPTPPTGTFHIGNGTLNGSLRFEAPNTGQATIDNSATITGGVTYNVADVGAKMDALNALSSTLGAQNGTDIAINTNTATSSQTVLGSSGALIGGNRVFDVTSFNSDNGEDLIVKANGSAGIVFNINNDADFHGNVYLEDLSGKFYGQAGYAGLTPDQVLFNLYGGAALLGGDDLDVDNQSNAGHPHNIIYGTFLNPNGRITFNHTRIVGRIFGGDTQDMVVAKDTKIVIPKPLSVPEPATFALALIGVAFLLRSRVRHPTRGGRAA